MAINVMQQQLSVATDSSSEALVSVNAAFLQEIKDVHTELWELLDETREMCRQRVRSESWQFRFANSMEELRDLFALHFALEEGFGYFDNPVFVDMEIAKRAMQLKSDHQFLYCEISDICEWIDVMRHDGTLMKQLAEVNLRFDSFCDQLEKHEEREQSLIYDSFNSDMGTGD